MVNPDSQPERPCFFVSDLHGSTERYEKLAEAIRAEKPSAVFLGGDLLPSGLWNFSNSDSQYEDYIAEVLAPLCGGLKKELGAAYPHLFAILGNDDTRLEEAAMRAGEEAGLWEYLHARKAQMGEHPVYGYACVPPTPFLMKDWERYDVSRFVDVGSVSPEEGYRSVPVEEHEIRYGTIEKDLVTLTGDSDLRPAIMLFHAPPHDCALDRAALDGLKVDHVPVSLHVGSIAIRRFIEKRRPLITLHGHIHESARMTGDWKTQIGATWCYSAAHDGSELALVRFSPSDPANATRELI
jgi:uncharacterized protein